MNTHDPQLAKSVQGQQKHPQFHQDQYQDQDNVFVIRPACPTEIQEDIESLAQECREIEQKLRTTLQRLKTLLGDDLSLILKPEIEEIKSEDYDPRYPQAEAKIIRNEERTTRMANLVNLSKESTPEDETVNISGITRSKIGSLTDIVIVRTENIISQPLRHYLIENLSGYKTEVHAAIGELGTLLGEYDEAHYELMNKFATAITEISRDNLEKSRETPPPQRKVDINYPEIPRDIKRYPQRIDHNALNQETIEKNLFRQLKSSTEQ